MESLTGGRRATNHFYEASIAESVLHDRTNRMLRQASGTSHSQPDHRRVCLRKCYAGCERGDRLMRPTPSLRRLTHTSILSVWQGRSDDVERIPNDHAIISVNGVALGLDLD
jgi:hypothetical protein